MEAIVVNRMCDLPAASSKSGSNSLPTRASLRLSALALRRLSLTTSNKSEHINDTAHFRQAVNEIGAEEMGSPMSQQSEYDEEESDDDGDLQFIEKMYGNAITQASKAVTEVFLAQHQQNHGDGVDRIPSKRESLLETRRNSLVHKSMWKAHELGINCVPGVQRSSLVKTEKEEFSPEDPHIPKTHEKARNRSEPERLSDDSEPSIPGLIDDSQHSTFSLLDDSQHSARDQLGASQHSAHDLLGNSRHTIVEKLNEEDSDEECKDADLLYIQKMYGEGVKESDPESTGLLDNSQHSTCEIINHCQHSTPSPLDNSNHSLGDCDQSSMRKDSIRIMRRHSNLHDAMLRAHEAGIEVHRGSIHEMRRSWRSSRRGSRYTRIDYCRATTPVSVVESGELVTSGNGPEKQENINKPRRVSCDRNANERNSSKKGFVSQSKEWKKTARRWSIGANNSNHLLQVGARTVTQTLRRSSLMPHKKRVTLVSTNLEPTRKRRSLLRRASSQRIVTLTRRASTSHQDCEGFEMSICDDSKATLEMLKLDAVESRRSSFLSTTQEGAVINDSIEMSPSDDELCTDIMSVADDEQCDNAGNMEHFSELVQNTWHVLKDDCAIKAEAMGCRLPFRILGTSADDIECCPHVLSPPLMESLQSFFPYSVSEKNFWLKFSLVRDGSSLQSLLQKAKGSRYTVIAIETFEGEVFGSFTSKPWEKNWNFYGDGESFLWRMRKTRKTHCHSVIDQARLESELDVYPWTGDNNLVQICKNDLIAVGGGGASDENVIGIDKTIGSVPSYAEDSVPYGFGLAIEDDLLRGTSNPCRTFRSPPLSHVHSDGSPFEIVNMEVWTLTPFLTVGDATKMESRLF